MIRHIKACLTIFLKHFKKIESLLLLNFKQIYRLNILLSLYSTLNDE